MNALSPALAIADTARIMQLTDTHLSSAAGIPERLRWLLDAIAADPPDAVVLSGDIVSFDPDDAADRQFARSVFDELPCPLLVIPGNHDVGFYGEEQYLTDRLAAFRDTWGGDRFAADAAGWRLVGVNAYLLGDAEHDGWLAASVGVDAPVAVFIHQPLVDDRRDGWEMPEAKREAFRQAVAGADIRLVASGHRHRYADLGRDVYVPSATMVGGHRDTWSDPRPGAVDFTFQRGGTVTHQLITPPM
jgi:3',5'-cyclic AMP phosphodiesterase CpdA